MSARAETDPLPRPSPDSNEPEVVDPCEALRAVAKHDPVPPGLADARGPGPQDRRGGT